MLDVDWHNFWLGLFFFFGAIETGGAVAVRHDGGCEWGREVSTLVFVASHVLCEWPRPDKIWAILEGPETQTMLYIY